MKASAGNSIAAGRDASAGREFGTMSTPKAGATSVKASAGNSIAASTPKGAMAGISSREGAGCRVQGAGCRVQGAGCRVEGAGCRVETTEGALAGRAGAGRVCKDGSLDCAGYGWLRVWRLEGWEGSGFDVCMGMESSGFGGFGV